MLFKQTFYSARHKYKLDAFFITFAHVQIMTKQILHSYIHLFQYYIAPVFKASSKKTFVKVREEKLEWPAKSSDLNTAEHFWINWTNEDHDYM